jgi:replicative DNA helicase
MYLMSDNLEKKLIRKLPSNVEAEQMLLGAILINHELLNHVTEFLRSEHFFEELHQKIYHAIEVVTEKNMSPTPVIVKTFLGGDQAFQGIGGESYLSKIATLAMMVINPYDYGRVIYDLAIKRNLIRIGEDVVNKAYDSSAEYSADAHIENAESQLYALASSGLNEKSFVRMQDCIAESLTSINRAMKNQDHVIGVSSGLLDLDTKLSGFHNSDLIILAGRPSMGKTAFAINFAINACKSLKHKNKDNDLAPSVGMFSLEMSSEQLATRLLSMYTGINSSSLRSGQVNEENYNVLRKSAVELSELNFYMDDSPALSISAIRTRARKLKRKNNLGLLVIDYLQLIKGNNKDNRVLEISEITQGLKALAKELSIPIIALAQLSRAVEQREDKRPMLSDLRESGSIEQDADVVMFLFREEYYLSRSQPQDGTEKHLEWQAKLNQVHNMTEIIVAKHRNGPVGTVRVYYNADHSKITNWQKEQG